MLARGRPSKVVAKVASDPRKPGGLTAVRPGKEAAFLAPSRSASCPGVGPRAEERLAAVGIETIGAIAALDDEALRTGLQRRGRQRAARPGTRDRPARPLEVSTERISLSQEETFARDVGDLERLHDELRRQATGSPRTCAGAGRWLGP